MSQCPEILRSASVPPAVLRVLSRLSEQGFRAFLVGGCVRDLLLGANPKDYDIATSARPEEVMKSFRRVLPTGVQHGTVTVISEGAHVEVTTFRLEGAYVDGRRPSSVEFHADIEADLSRRDFTINAMAFDPVRLELVDPFGGQDDLAQGIVRCVGTAADRFSEDGLRPMRAVRFAAVFGFRLEPETETAVAPALATFRKVAVERVREEFNKLLTSARPRYGLELCLSTGLLGVMLPEVVAGQGVPLAEDHPGDVWQHTLATVELARPSLELRLAALLLEVGKPRSGSLADGFEGHEAVGASIAQVVLERMKYPVRVTEDVRRMVLHHRLLKLASASDGQLRRTMATIGPAHVPLLLELVVAHQRAHSDADGARAQALSHRILGLLERRPPLSTRDLALKGQEIMAVLGVGPSPIVGEAARFLLDQVLELPERNTPEALGRLLAAWASTRP